MRVVDFIMYGLAIGLSRASILLILPIAGYFTDVSDFGQLSLYITSSSIMSIFLSFNISSIVARETYTDLKSVINWVYLCNVFLIVLMSVFFLLIIVTERCVGLFAFGFFVSEAMFLVNSTYLRYRLGPKDYLLLAFVKIIVIASLMLFLFYFNSAWVIGVLFVITLSNCTVFLFYVKVKGDFIAPIGYGFIKSFKELKLKYFIFAMSLIPHSFAQWIISGADRFFIKYTLSDFDLGIYSFSYSIASFLLIVSSAFSLGFTQFCIKDRELYSSDKFYLFLFLFSTLTIVVFLFFSDFLLNFFPDYNTSVVRDIVFYVAVGIYFLFFYLYFSAAIFYDRDVKVMSNITLLVSFLTLLSLYPVILLFGVVGASYVTMLSYFVYMVLAARSSFLNVNGRLVFPVVFAALICFFIR